MVQFIMTSFSEGIPILSASLSKASISSWVGMSSGSNNPFSISFLVAFFENIGRDLAKNLDRQNGQPRQKCRFGFAQRDKSFGFHLVKTSVITTGMAALINSQDNEIPV